MAKLIPKSNLDDRSFADIVDEAIRLIPRYCPEWTNHNPTDPGITLIELFAWMTEMTLYRLNRVPEKTYLSLLELMGLSLVPPQSARTVIRFFPVEGTRKTALIKRGTQIVAVSGTDDSFVFETERDLLIKDNRLESCVNRVGEKWVESCSENFISPFQVFDAEGSVEHSLYLSSSILEYLSGGNSVVIEFESVQEILSVQGELTNYLYWEYWDGRDWSAIEAQRSMPGVKKRDNTIILSGPVPIQEREVSGQNGYFVRANLAGIPEQHSVLSIKNVLMRAVFSSNGFIPDLCLVNSGSVYSPIDMNNTFRMFSENPVFNEVFYIAGDSIFSNWGTRVLIAFTFSEIYVPGNENENVRFEFEYWNGNDWMRLSEKEHSLRDATFSFKQQGTVSFTIPEDISNTTVNNEDHYWIRVRLVTKDFSIGGQYVKDEKDNWIWQFSSRVHSPVFSRLRISYEPKKRQPQLMLSQTNFKFIDHSNRLNADVENNDLGGDLLVFDIRNEEMPSLYLGFASAFPEGDASFYIRIDETRSPKPLSGRLTGFEKFAANTNDKRQIDINWQYWNGSSWINLSITDYTDSFHQSGFVEFSSPSDISLHEEFGKELFWFRALHMSGSFESRPRINDIILNAVYAKNCKTYRDEVIASGTGAPGQSCSPVHGPILPGLELFVDEGSIPPAKEIDAMKNDGIVVPYYEEGESIWVRYREVDNFYSSTSISRHFMTDYRNNILYFGDGIRGINPPRKKFNIKIKSYSVGGGSEGNLAPHTLRVMTQSIPFVAGCDNPFAAEGGSDMETVDNLKSRAAGVFKSLQRAVTAEDFQWLARESSASVGRAYCLPERNSRGEICVSIIPVMPQGGSLAERLVPSRELIRRATSYLDNRKLVGTRIKVHPPLFRNFEINISLVYKSDVLDTEFQKKLISESLLLYFHVLKGDSGEGWPFGKDVTEGAILKQLEKSEGILSVDMAEIFDLDAGVAVEKLVLKDDELPYLSAIRINNRREIR